MTTKRDWDSLERWVIDLARKARLARPDQGRAQHPRPRPCSCGPRTNLECEHEINSKGPRRLLDSIIKEAKTIQKKLQEALEPAQPAGDHHDARRDSSAAEERSQQTRIPGKRQAQQTHQPDSHDPNVCRDSSALEQSLQAPKAAQREKGAQQPDIVSVNNEQQQIAALRYSTRERPAHTSEVYLTAFETKSSTTRSRTKAASSPTSSRVVPVTDTLPSPS
ncbi:hypothetical protein EJ02DRAFT_513096 [Clathrospora elynae]|uniref:Uncharacterized protein n=1 Tax=Clathrospora elynae TaxID=706981 RepID=A0A6A5SPE8_9PLEO|nr:hypothetical protein EJ02DRAFT_513096 [Clathrospora elynae]